MRALFTILIITAVIAVVYYQQKDDKDSYMVKGLAQIRQLFDQGLGGDQTTTIYKIQDKEGNWVYSNKPPQRTNETGEGRIEKLEIDPNANVIPSIIEKDKEK